MGVGGFIDRYRGRGIDAEYLVRKVQLTILCRLSL